MIRNAQEDDIIKCTQLIYESGPALFSYLYSSDKAGVLDLLEYFFSKPDNTFSKDGIIVDEEDGIVRAAIAVLPVRILGRFLFNEVKLMMNKYGFFKGTGKIIKLISKASLARNYPPLLKDEMFISNLAVFKEYRGLGISTALLKSVEERAKNWGFRKLTLFVETDNSHAKMVYEKFGFKEAGRADFLGKYKKYGLSGFYKMVKEL